MPGIPRRLADFIAHAQPMAAHLESVVEQMSARAGARAGPRWTPSVIGQLEDALVEVTSVRPGDRGLEDFQRTSRIVQSG